MRRALSYSIKRCEVNVFHSLLSRVSSLSLPLFQIHIIDFDDENNIINKNVLLHQAGEIWHIATSPADKAVLTTCYNKSKYYSFHWLRFGLLISF